MSLITAHDVAKEFGPEDIFSGINAEIPQRARIALVGPNGAGKTTLLNILIGRDQASAGSVHRAKGIRIGFLPQRPELHSAHTLNEELMSAFTELRAQEARLNELEHAMTDPARMDEAIIHYGELQEQFEAAGGYTYEQRLKTVTQGLGFAPEDGERHLGQFSGGQKTRALLARLLLEAPDLLALDEPTNHLDIEAIQWLEGFLKDFSGAVLVVSHDRYFMDAVADTVWELDFGALERYRGNYSHYVRQREERHERRWKDYEAQQEFIAKEQEYIRRNLAGQNTKQAQGRRTRLERLLRDEAVRRPRARDPLHLKLGATIRSGDKVLETKGLAVGYADAPEPLFYAPDIVLRRGEVAALIGANGAGKSTFVKTVIGDLAPLAGAAKLGAAVKIGYFAQAHESLDPKQSIIDTVLDAKPMTISEARGYLAQFLFTDDDVFRPIGTLSGGERGRVALATLALTGANFLLLDEPTNHLDIDSQEVLQNVLAGFPGTILIVSHDRYLIAALATQIWAVSAGAPDGALDVFNGSYAEYLSAKASSAAAENVPATVATANTNGNTNGAKVSQKKHGLNPFQLQKRLAELETRIPELEAHLHQISADLADASARANADRVRALTDAYAAAEIALHDTMAEWEKLIE